MQMNWKSCDQKAAQRPKLPLPLGEGWGEGGDERATLTPSPSPNGRGGLGSGGRGGLRRGNTIVLVTGILALLVIIATAYITRTQAARITSTAYKDHGYRRNNVEAIADELANEAKIALFVRDTFWLTRLDPNGPRKLPSSDALRHGMQLNEYDAGGNLINFNPLNFAPYHVVPWTNWPDGDYMASVGADMTKWPRGSGNLLGGFGQNAFVYAALAPEDNPPGSPGMGDTRWLRDLEPLRFDTWDALSSPAGPGQDGIPDAYSHWRHLTNIARPDNGWRIVRNIDDIDGPTGKLLVNLAIPVEQWLPMQPNPSTRFGVTSTGRPTATAVYPGALVGPAPIFEDQWTRWFGDGQGHPLNVHADIMTNPDDVPHNFYRLSDLDGDGVRHEIGERPMDEFIRGTARWNVSRVLADTDGDGFTDSFWFLAPTSSQSGIRQLVAISIIDNSGMLNVNVATRFLRNDAGLPTGLKKTLGLGPFDLALVGELNTFDREGIAGNHWGNWNTGSLDIPEHHYLVNAADEPDIIPQSGGTDYYKYDYDAGLDSNPAANPRPYQRLMQELGFSLIATPSQNHPTMAARLDFWRRSASRILTSDMQTGFNPFTTGDELELRMFAGNNSPWTFSRFEYAVQPVNADYTSRFLRANTNIEESNEYLEQRPNRKLLTNPRNKLTLFNGARNDLMPAWTWVFGPHQQYGDLNGDSTPGWLLPPYPTDPNDPTYANYVDRRLFEAGMQKFDLRLGGRFAPVSIAAPVGPGGNYTFTVDANGNPALNHSGNPLDPQSILYNTTVSLALRDRIERCLIDAPDGWWAGANNPANNPAMYPNTYFGKDASAVFGGAPPLVQKTRQLAAAYAANIKDWRDADGVTLLTETVPARMTSSVEVAEWPQYMGMEPQPFIVEVFIGHVYRSVLVPPTDPEGDPYGNAGHNVILEEDTESRRSTVVAVQIANPYNVPIDLTNYMITVFGRPLVLRDAVVINDQSPDDPNPPSARVILEPATDEKPTTAIYYSIHKDLIGPQIAPPFNTRWKNFLDVDPADHPVTTIIASPRTSAMTPPPTPSLSQAWSTDRDDYDSDLGPAVELRRFDPQGDPMNINHWVVIDRIDSPGDREFGEKVNLMEASTPPPMPVPYPPDVEPGDLHPGYDIGPDQMDVNGTPAYGYDHWVQWVRATRAWGVDLNLNSAADLNAAANGYPAGTHTVHRFRHDPNERSPRFVFGDRAVVTPSGTAVSSPETDGRTYMHEGNRYKFRATPDGEGGDFDGNGTPDDGSLYRPAPQRPWFTRSYRMANNVVVPELTGPYREPPAAAAPNEPAPRKPTFFDMNRGPNDAAFNAPAGSYYAVYHPFGSGYPDKGWYSQGDDVGDATLDANGNSTVRLRFPMQMLHKNSDFDQIGELLNVYLWGHELKYTNTGFSGETYKTFSERMSEEVNDLLAGPSATLPERLAIIEALPRVNRLRAQPVMGDLSATPPSLYGQVIGTVRGACMIGAQCVADLTNLDCAALGGVWNGPDTACPGGSTPARFDDPRLSMPALPAGVRLLDAFVCDGPGVVVADVTGPTMGVADGIIDQRDEEFQRLMNAKRFDGSATPGLVNLGTATPEVMRAIPHWYRLVHETGRPRRPDGSNNPNDIYFNNAAQTLVTEANATTAETSLLPRTLLAEAMTQYREGFNGYNALGACSFGTECALNMTATDCGMQGGTWRGENSTCDPSTWNASAAVSALPTGVGAGSNYERRRELALRSGYNPTPATIDTVRHSNWLRGERGFASIGETLLLTRAGSAPPANPIWRPTANPAVNDVLFNQYWRADLGVSPRHGVELPPPSDPPPPPSPAGYAPLGAMPYWGLYAAGLPYQASATISTDRHSVYDPFLSDWTDPNNPIIRTRPDNVAGDVEEANTLFAGASNMITTRSDVFTVYFRVRSFRQNISVNPPVWDATNPEYIVDDSRYVMLIDRSNVNKPGDKPRILYLEKLPN